MIRYVHTNIVAKDWRMLSAFYQKVFGCKPAPPPRDLSGDWLDRLTGLKSAHITGEHLVLPGYEGMLPTLEIFSYDQAVETGDLPVNGYGLAHLAFEVDDVEAVLAALIEAGGGQVGQVIQATYPGPVTATFVYAKDPEGNIIEIQNWKR